ncbi:MAG: MobA/MobL family protein [Candidatus Saccharibacteria bacterium]|nr:MobA/MobL family protein [Rhodoferax sp.]
MAIYHLTAKWHTRKKNSKLRALRAYAYRAGARVFDPLNNRVYNSTNKKEVVHCETLGPPNAAAWMLDPLTLWAHVEQRESRRRDSVFFAEWEGAVPNELSLDECKAIVSGFVAEYMVAEGQVVSWALHDKPGNRHFHAMCTTRDIEGDGFGQKNNRWRQWAMLYKTREGLAKHINMALEKAGLPQRVTHKSYADLGIDREPSQHVGPEYSGNRDATYRAKRDERLRNNRRVKVVNQQRGKRRSAAARKCLVAGDQGAKLMAVVRDQLKDARQLDAVPVTPAMSSEALVAHKHLHTVLPDADEIYLAVGRVRTGLGREWNWQAMAAQCNRVDKLGGDVLTALLVKELIWVFSRSPEQAPEFAKLVPRTRLADVAVAAKNWAQSASKPDALYLIDSILQTAGIGVSDGSGIQAVVLTGNSAALDFSNYADALAPLAYLISDMSELVGVCQRVAHSIEKKISPDILAKRVNRILANDTWPTTQAELLDALVAGEVVFAAKRRQHRLADVLDAVPPDRRSHFEAIVTSVLGGCTVDAGHAVASRALSQQAQMEVQAECNLRMALTDWQLADHPARCAAMAAIGKAYPWSEFQRDIQRHAQSASGWQSAWWQEQQTKLQGHELATFCERLPTWLTPTRTKQYPLGAHDPDPAMTLMRNLRAQSTTPPDPSSFGREVKVPETATPVNPWPGHRGDVGRSTTQPSVTG